MMDCEDEGEIREIEAGPTKQVREGRGREKIPELTWVLSHDARGLID